MFGQLEHLPVVDPTALEYGRPIVQPMAQYMHLRIAPGREFAIHPDGAVALVEGNQSHLEASKSAHDCAAPIDWAGGASSTFSAPLRGLAT